MIPPTKAMEDAEVLYDPTNGGDGGLDVSIRSAGGGLDIYINSDDGGLDVPIYDAEKDSMSP